MRQRRSLVGYFLFVCLRECSLCILEEEVGGGGGLSCFLVGSLEFQDSWGVIMNVFLCLVDPNAITAFSSGPCELFEGRLALTLRAEATFSHASSYRENVASARRVISA